jgi:hypothetical protein
MACYQLKPQRESAMQAVTVPKWTGVQEGEVGTRERKRDLFGAERPRARV